MSCPNGTRRKAGSPDYFIISVRDVICALYGADSLFCRYASGGLGPIIPNAWGDTTTLCASNPSYPPGLTITDFPTGWVSKAIQIGMAHKWSTYCECKPDTPPPPFIGGQCTCVKYDVYFDSYQSNGTQVFNGFSAGQFWGPILGIRPLNPPGSGGNAVLVKSRGVANQSCNSAADWHQGTVTDGSILFELSIDRVVRVDGLPDNCGNPSADEGPPPPPPDLGPPPLLPDNLPPPAPRPDCSNCPPGPRGERGEPGERGALGATGERGLPGIAGAAGAMGPQGVPGQSGATGPQGISGATGPMGSQGVPGESGVTGPQGIPGATGPIGPRGVPGATGPQGVPGATGPMGPQGLQGEPGFLGGTQEVEFEDLDVPVVFCNEGVPEFDTQTIQIITGTATQILLSFETLAAIQVEQCLHGESIAAVPEWWQLRPEGKRPQLVVQCGVVQANGKVGRAEYPVTIPHYQNFGRALHSPVPPYVKGNWEGILTLVDNSKLIVNCISAEECDRVIGAIKAYITPSKLIGALQKNGVRKGQPIIEQTVIAKYAKYFPEGMQNLNPEWIAYF